MLEEKNPTMLWVGTEIYPSLMISSDFRSSEFAEARCHSWEGKRWKETFFFFLRLLIWEQITILNYSFFSTSPRAVWWCWSWEDCTDHGVNQQRCQSPWWLFCVCWCWWENPWGQWLIPWNDWVWCYQLKRCYLKGEYWTDWRPHGRYAMKLF